MRVYLGVTVGELAKMTAKDAKTAVPRTGGAVDDTLMDEFLSHRS